MANHRCHNDKKKRRKKKTKTFLFFEANAFFFAWLAMPLHILYDSPFLFLSLPRLNLSPFCLKNLPQHGLNAAPTKSIAARTLHGLTQSQLTDWTSVFVDERRVKLCEIPASDFAELLSFTAR